MNRRDYLKQSALLAAGTALAGCDAAEAPPRDGIARNTWDQGAVPIKLSGWTVPEGVQAAHPALQGDIDTDFAVVGAGLAGSSLALHLAEAGVGVVVLEARQPGWGASGRNAGHVLPTLRDVGVFEHFPDKGKAFLDIYRDHYRITFELSRRHGIACDATQSGYMHITDREGTFESLKKRSLYWRDKQGQPVEWLQDGDVRAITGSDYYRFGVLYGDGGRVNPYRFTNGMIRAALELGARVFGDTEARVLEKDGERWRIRCAGGSVRASRVVFCTNAYPTDIVPAFTNNFYPLTAYALTTAPLPEAARRVVVPGGATISQEPMDLNPLVVDEHWRLVLSSIPSASRPDDAESYWQQHLAWIHRTWPETKDMDIRLGEYWTGRVAMRDREFPGVFQVQPGVFGLMHFNAWGNLMAPLMGMLFARGLAADRPDQLPFPVETPAPVADPGKKSFYIRTLMIPAARLAQRAGFV